MKPKILTKITLFATLLAIGLLLGATAAQPVLAQAPAPTSPNAPSACMAQETSYRATFGASKDSYVSEVAPDTNYGTSVSLSVGRVTIPSAGRHDALVAFNISSLPADAIILTATLELYQTSGSGFDIKAQALTGAWSETVVTWNNQPTFTTQDEVVEGSAVNGWRQWDLTPIAQAWHAGTLSNQGVRLIFDFGTISTRSFASSEAASDPPRLVIEYQRQATLTSQTDTFIREASPSSNYGNSSNALIGRDGSTYDESYGLFQFDLSGIPAGSTIISASFGLFPQINRMSPTAPQLALSLDTEGILDSWNEMGVTWYSQPGSQAMGDPPTVWVQAMTWNWWDVTQLAQAWSSGAMLNYGVMVKPSGVTTGSADIVMREGGSDPQLVIIYGPPPCYEVTGVSISGPTQGITDTDYTFESGIAPVTATLPITYTWEADEQTPASGEDATFTWSTPGTQHITLTVENCYSSIVVTYEVSITVPDPACDYPIAGLILDGPAMGLIDTGYAFTASVRPSNATLPVTITWEADGQAPASGENATFTWSTAGTKQITVTAENRCSVFMQHHSVIVMTEAQLPDVEISGMWYNPLEMRAYYIIKNVGNSTAPGGHTINLTQAISEVVQTTYALALQPGWVRSGYINYEWYCAVSASLAKICADVDDTILEGDEANNCFDQWWQCDIFPPQIIAGPTVGTTTEHTSVITWQTDEPCTSQVDYGRSGAAGGILSINDNSPKTNHEATLDTLNNASTYWFKVYVTDGGDNLANSNDAYFETQPPGTDPLVVTSYGMVDYPLSSFYEFYTLSATVGEVAGADRVSFFLDGQPAGTDYSPSGDTFEVYFSPAAAGLTRSAWFGNGHTLEVRAYNLENEVTTESKSVTPANHPMPGKTNIVSPDPGKEIFVDGNTAPAGTSINSLAYVAQYEWGCTDSGFSEGSQVPPGLSAVMCDDVRHSVSSMRLYLDDDLVETHIPPAGTYNHWFAVDLAGKSTDYHTLKLEGHTTTGTVISTEVDIEIKQGRGDLEFARSVTRDANVFEVTLTISNTGTGTTYVDYVDDFVRGFQVIEGGSQPGLQAPTANHYVVTGDTGVTPERVVHIDLYSDEDNNETVLAAGASFVINYQLVPVLYPQSEAHYIGNDPTEQTASRVHYRYGGVPGEFNQNIYANGNWVDGMGIETSVQQAAAGSDYILVTSPAGLAAYSLPINWRANLGTQRELSMLLSSMAELATLRNGVLGFLPINPCSTTVDDLLESGGLWANALHPNFREPKSGYVLFVGEDEIIPPQGAPYGIPYSDLRYASTSGQAKPELVLGRAAGHDLGTMREALDTSIAVARTGIGFDRQRALLNSGRASGEGDFWTQINQINDRLDFPFVRRLRWKSLGNTEDIIPEVQAEMALGQSLVAYRGHGGPEQWGYDSSARLTTSDIATFNFNGYHPFVWGLACSTADYANYYSMPEAWLRNGAGGYVGSVNVAYTGRNGVATRAFFNRWGGDSSLSVGYTIVDMERDHWGDSSDWRFWTYQHHLFGDPKFGATTGVVRTLAPTIPDGPIGQVGIVVPDYTVTTDEEGMDHVTLPGDGEWLNLNDYVVPTWKETFTYPQGQRVQDVVLTAQSGLTVATGLHIPTDTMAIDCNCAAVPTLSQSADAALQNTTAISGWYPQFEPEYEWAVYENPDGTSILEIIIYPFTYNPVTTDARFYRKWGFDVEVFTTTVSIGDLSLPQPTYRLTETVTANLVIDNADAEQSVVVWAEVRSNQDDSVVSALPLQTLHAVSGTSALELAVPAGLAAGDYTFAATLADMEGNVLDSDQTGFIHGFAESVATGLTGTPEMFQIGDTISLTLSYHNSGDVTLDGVATIRIQTADGMTQTAEFTRTFSSFAPGASLTFAAAWDSTGAPDVTDFRAAGFVQYANTTSNPIEIALSTRAFSFIYLPMILR